MQFKKNIFPRGFRFLSKHGVFGRKRQVIYFFSYAEDAGYNVNKKEWERLYQKIKKQYTEIRLHRLWSTRIGEYIARYLTAVEDSKVNATKGILDVFVLSDCKEHNMRLSKVMGRNISIIDTGNIDIWTYILNRFPKIEFIKYWNEYAVKDKNRFRYSNKTVQYFTLTEEEKEEGAYKKKLLGVEGEFVAALSRDEQYLATILPMKDASYHNYRDSDINMLTSSANYLAQKGVTVVRMGRYVKQKVSFDNCVDYANKYYDELMDIVLMKDCKFFIGDPSGIAFLPMVLNRPVALKNYIPVFLNSESFPYNPSNLYIFKKYYLKKENRFLSVKEMMQIEKQIKKNVRYDGKLYEELGIEVVENNAEEILDLVMEMNERIDGEWVEKAEDVELQNKYQTIYREWCQQQQYKESEILHFKVGTMFLRKNLFLVE